MMQAAIWLAGGWYVGESRAAEVAQIRAGIAAAKHGWTGQDVRLIGRQFFGVVGAIETPLGEYTVGELYPVEGLRHAA